MSARCPSRPSLPTQMRRDLDIRLLRTFLVIAECGSFTRAGERLHLTQSAVSNQLKRLALQLGARLIERNGKVEMLSEEGRMLQAFARRILKTNDEAIEAMLPTQVSGLVRVGLVEEVMDDRFTDILSEFNERHLAVRLELTVGLTRHLLAELGREEIDVVVSKRPAGVESGGMALYRDRLVWVAHSEFRWVPTEPVPLVLSPAPCIHRSAILNALERTQHPWHVTCHAPTLNSVRTAVLAKLGISALDERTVTTSMRTLGPPDGLATLPDNEIVLHTSPSPSATAKLLTALIEARFAG